MHLVPTKATKASRGLVGLQAQQAVDAAGPPRAAPPRRASRRRRLRHRPSPLAARLFVRSRCQRFGDLVDLLDPLRPSRVSPPRRARCAASRKENLQRLTTLFSVELELFERLLQRTHAKAIHRLEAMRQLVVVATVLDEQRLVDETDLEARADAQPEVVVLAGRERLVEATDLVEETLLEQRRRRRHDAQVEAVLVDPAAALAMLATLQDLVASPDPDLVAVPEAQFGPLGRSLQLSLQLLRFPLVVRIEEGDPACPSLRRRPGCGRGSGRRSAGTDSAAAARKNASQASPVQRSTTS